MENNQKCPCKADLFITANMMKFPKPRHLLTNDYPDLTEDQPTILKKLVTQIINPEENSRQAEYIDATIKYIKKQGEETTKKLKLFNVNVGRNLFFINVQFPPSEEIVTCLVDTGASNSLLHESVVKRLKLPVEPTNMKISTATCTSSDVIVGTSHLKFRLRTENDNSVEFCSNFVITNKLNGLECILGAEFLLDEERVVSISASKLVVKYNSLYYMLPITSEIPPTLVNFVNVNNTLAEDIQHFREDIQTEEDLETPFIPQEIDINEKEDAAPMAYHFNHNIEADFENETLPPSEQFFDNTYELKF